MSIDFSVDLNHKNAKRLQTEFLDPFAAWLVRCNIAGFDQSHLDSPQSYIGGTEAAHVNMMPYYHKDGECTNPLITVRFFRDGTAQLSYPLSGGFSDPEPSCSWSEAAIALIREAHTQCSEALIRAEECVKPAHEELQAYFGDLLMDVSAEPRQ